MKNFADIKSFNKYVGIPPPLDSEIDAGVYPEDTLLKSEKISVDFYRISFKTNYINPDLLDYDSKNPNPVTAVFFNSPGKTYEWDLQEKFEGYYLQLSKRFFDTHGSLYQNFLEYDYHEALFLTKEEEQEIIGLYQNLISKYRSENRSQTVIVAYVGLILTLVESFFKRQFLSDGNNASILVKEFQNLLKNTYKNGFADIPTVSFFAQKMNLTPNYLGDILKAKTNKSAIEHIHSFIMDKAKEMLLDTELLSAEVGFRLGFSYPTYFSKFFKKNTGLSPTEYRMKYKNY